jgi:glycine betaine transporter
MDRNGRTEPGNQPREWLPLFWVALVLCAAVACYGLWAPGSLTRVTDLLSTRVFTTLDWFFMMSVSGFLVLALALAFGRYGQLRLGGAEDRPEFSTASWMAMLFAAGMGSGLVFWGVAEPLTHFASPPMGTGGTAAAARQAMVMTNFHWGLHAWAIYGIGALVLAYFTFRRDTNGLAGAPIRSAFVGAWVAPVAWAADLVAVLAVAFGVAASIGMGVMQIRAGLNVVTGLSADSGLLGLGVLALLMICAMTSATTGLKRGIKWLSNVNMVIAILLLLFVLLAGPTGFLLRSFFTAVGDYLTGVVSLSLRLYPYQNIGEWFQSWTLTYFVWWIAWAPFVGIFVARISRGRTIREFVLGVLVAPTLFSILWFAVFGGTGIHQELFGAGGMARLVQENVTAALFALFHRLPLAGLLDATAISLNFIFLVTSVDSATFVLGMLTSNGSPNPPRSRRLAWGTGLTALTAPLVLVGEIRVFKAVMVSGVLPYALVLLIQASSLLRALRADAPLRQKKEAV